MASYEYLQLAPHINKTLSLMLTFPISLAPLDSDISDISVTPTALSAAAHQACPNQAQEPVAKLGWILIQKRWISAAQLQTALLNQIDHQPHCSKKLGELLIEQAMLSEAQLKNALQEQYWRRHGYWVI
jgi:hypothetical protein